MSEKKDAPKPIIIPTPNGPYIYINDFTPKEVRGLTNSKGEKQSHMNSAALCRCGQSESKPFCDSTHWDIGFKDEKN